MCLHHSFQHPPNSIILIIITNPKNVPTTKKGKRKKKKEVGMNCPSSIIRAHATHYIFTQLKIYNFQIKQTVNISPNIKAYYTVAIVIK